MHLFVNVEKTYQNSQKKLAEIFVKFFVFFCFDSPLYN